MAREGCSKKRSNNFISSFFIIITKHSFLHFFSYNARQLYVNEKNKEYIVETVKFLGMKDGNFVKNSRPKNTYFTFEMNGKYYQTIINSDLENKLLKFKTGDEIVIKYIDGGLLEGSIIITDIQK